MTEHSKGAAGSFPGPHDLFLEPFGGLAGDMFLAGLLDLGDPRFTLADLQGLADALVPGEAHLTATVAWRGSLSGTHLSVETPETKAPPHRHLKDLAEIIDSSPLTPFAREFTMAVLRRIAVAEGAVHGCTPEEIHFHEVGAVDTLIDVGGAGLALERLGVRRVYGTPPILGSGTVRCAHGEMPVPAPATAEILKGVPAIFGGGGGERCTPTGAAILMELLSLGLDSGRAVSFGAPEGTFRPLWIGYGAGTRDPREGPPNLLRVQLGEARQGRPRERSAGDEGSGTVDELRVNLDDMTPEDVGIFVGALRKAGALEVFTSAVSMKKDRPGVLVSALVRPEERESLVAVCFRHSSTFGVRWTQVQRITAGRRFDTLQVGDQQVAVKVRLAPDGRETAFFEHDDLARLAEALGVPLEAARRRAFGALAESAPAGD